MNNKVQTAKRAAQAVLLAAFVSLMAPAHAAPVDVTGVVSDINGQVGPITLIGGAVLLVIVAVAAFGWVRRAIR